HLVQSYFVGKSKKGNAVIAGKFRRYLGKAMGSKVAAALDAYATFFRSVWRRAAQLSKLRRDGKLDVELENELAKGLGLEQVQYEQSVKTEMEQMVEEHLEYLENLEWGGEAFSMLPL